MELCSSVAGDEPVASAAGDEDAAPLPTAREARKAELAARLCEQNSQRERTRLLKSALRVSSPERSADDCALLAKHPEEVARLRETMEKSEARKIARVASMAEVVEDDAAIHEKVCRLAELMRAAQHVVVYTGAGLSTAAQIPDYRGPQGIWTLSRKGEHNASAAAKASVMSKSFIEAAPTAGHMALVELVSSGHVQHVVSQNVDGLHMRSGIPAERLCELHGNVFREVCPACSRVYTRGFDVTARSAYHRHTTDRLCERAECAATKTALRDTIIYFGEKVEERTLGSAQEHARRADLAIFLGSSLKVLQHYKYIWEQPRRPTPRRRFAIINLQPTPKDRLADVRIHGSCDEVLRQLLRELQLQLPRYDPARDAVLQRAPPAAIDVARRSAMGAGGARGSDGVETVGEGSGGGGEAAGLACGGAPRVGANAGRSIGPAPVCAASLPPEETDATEAEAAPAVPPDADAGPTAAVRKRKRRGGASCYRRRQMPRAFPREAPPPAAEEGGGGGAEGGAEGGAGAGVAHDGGSAVTLDAQDPSSGACESETAAVPAAAPRSSAALPAIKCVGRCGFYGSAERDGYCTKCYAKRTAELSEWYGAGRGRRVTASRSR